MVDTGITKDLCLVSIYAHEPNINYITFIPGQKNLQEFHELYYICFLFETFVTISVYENLLLFLVLRAFLQRPYSRRERECVCERAREGERGTERKCVCMCLL